jgi:hypothetical protein
MRFLGSSAGIFSKFEKIRVMRGEQLCFRDRVPLTRAQFGERVGVRRGDDARGNGGSSVDTGQSQHDGERRACVCARGESLLYCVVKIRRMEKGARCATYMSKKFVVGL